MSDVPTTIVSNSPDGNMFSKESMKELEDQLAALTPEDFKDQPAEQAAPEPEPEIPAEEAPAEEVSVEEPAETEEAPAEEPEEETEEDAASLAAERLGIEMEQLQAKYDLQMAHNARLAGMIGHLQKQQEALTSRPSEPSYEPDTDSEVGSALAREVADLKSRFVQAEVSQAIALGSTALDEPEARDMREEIIAAAANYKAEMESVFAMTDPELARQNSEALSRCIIADAREARWQSRHASLVERKAATVKDSVLKKRAQTISGSGSVPPPPPKPKALNELNADEADAWLRQNVPPL